jgi:hypothetical protein
VYQLAVQFPGDVHDTSARPFLPVTLNWTARPHRPFTLLTTNAGLPPPTAQLPGPEQDKEPIPIEALLTGVESVVRPLQRPLCSAVTKA